MTVAQSADHAVSSVERVKELNGQVQSVLDDVLKDVTHVAVVDFPSHANIGDSVIWYGEMEYLKSRGIKINYVCDVSTYSKEKLQSAIGSSGTILIHGGGNLGDLWPSHQRLKESVINDFPDNPIVQLPQTLCFQDASNIESVKQCFNRHQNLTLLLRDEVSYRFASENFSCRSILCCDIALTLGPIQRVAPEQNDIISLTRTDHETTLGGKITSMGENADLHWTNNPKTWKAKLSVFWLKQSLERPNRVGGLTSLLGSAYRTLAAERYRLGLETVARGRVVMTDRLHGHILCLLQGIPHVLFPDKNGKLLTFWKSWTEGIRNVTFADSFEDAKVMAKELCNKISKESGNE